MDGVGRQGIECHKHQDQKGGANAELAFIKHQKEQNKTARKGHNQKIRHNLKINAVFVEAAFANEEIFFILGVAFCNDGWQLAHVELAHGGNAHVI